MNIIALIFFSVVILSFMLPVISENNYKEISNKVCKDDLDQVRCMTLSNEARSVIIVGGIFLFSFMFGISFLWDKLNPHYSTNLKNDKTPTNNFRNGVLKWNVK